MRYPLFLTIFLILSLTIASLVANLLAIACQHGTTGSIILLSFLSGTILLGIPLLFTTLAPCFTKVRPVGFHKSETGRISQK